MAKAMVSPMVEKAAVVVGGLVVGAGVLWLIFRPKDANAATPPPKSTTTTTPGPTPATPASSPLPGQGAPLFKAGDKVILAGDMPDPTARLQFAAIQAALAAQAPDIQWQVPVQIPLDTERDALDLTPLATAYDASGANGVILLWSADASLHRLEPDTSFGAVKLVEVPLTDQMTFDQAKLLDGRSARSRIFGLNVPVDRSDPVAYAQALLADVRAPAGLPAGRTV